ncbi:hypothetical protein CAEBREN_16746 [Caenorhabditis brenneri]|uniref:Uncharacterized protein n=1 Tax=Caenorhabditis brenneri TaxID=135651 RepID=G0NHN1_CAEBE|nr:hypothetical protein CAEBREN_16746 [Caenorhabditis brenneri]
MFDEFYYSTKNRHPSPTKNHSRNAYCRFFTRYLKTEATIVKTYHLDPSDGLFGARETDREVFDQDLIPFVKYSLNKKKRWEAESQLRLLNALQKTYKDHDVYVMDRVCLRSSPYFYPGTLYERLWYFFHLFPIRKIHHLEADQTYICTSTNSIWGQSFDSLQPENRSSKKPRKQKFMRFEIPSSSSRPKVAYHIITPPKNYETLRNKDSRFTSSNKIVYSSRCRNKKDILLDLRYYEIDEPEDKEEEDCEEQSSLETAYAPKKIIDWADHMIYCRPNFHWRIHL